MIKWPSWLAISYTRKRKGHWRAAKNISIHQVSLLIIWTRYAVHQGNFDHIKTVFVNFFHRCAFNFRKTCFFGQPSEQIQGWAKFPISLIIHEYKISGNFIPDFIRTWDTQQIYIYTIYWDVNDNGRHLRQQKLWRKGVTRSVKDFAESEFLLSKP